MLRARTTEAKELRRVALLRAALEEFFERGFAAARMDDIAARSGLSKGTLYLYFDSKEALFESVIEEFAIPNVERVEAALNAAPDLRSALEAMFALAPIVIRESEIPKIAKVLIGDAPAFPQLLTSYRKRVVERVLDALTRALEKAKAAGEINIDDPVLTARLIIAPKIMSGIWRVAFGHDDDAEIDLEKLFAEHRRILFRGLGLDGDK